MADHRLNILPGVVPDSTGDIFPDVANNQLALTNVKNTPVMVMQDPGGSGDEGFEGAFRIPENFVGTPRIEIRYIIDGTPASVVAFGFQEIHLTDSEAFDAAYGTEDIASNSDWTGYADEDEVEEEITLTPATAFVIGDSVYFFFYIDDGTHTFTGNVLITGLDFLYADA